MALTGTEPQQLNSVFILGAGASAHAGVPLMSTFFQVAEDLLWSGTFRREDEIAFQIVLRGRAQLQAVLAKARFDVRNLEAVFTAFEMAQLFGELGSLQQHEIEALTWSMRRVIVSTIEHRMVLNVISTGKIRPSAEYDRFARVVSLLVNKAENISFITFNYDVGLEVALAVHGFHVDYCFNPEPDLPGKGQQMLELMKLHGSVNWAECSECDAIVHNQVFDIIAGMEKAFALGANFPDRVTLRALQGASLVHCGKPCRTEPMIVPPTADKAGLRRSVQPVWKRAAQRLREADNIFVVGYSWPETDQFFHQLYAVGTVGNRILRRFWIFDPDPAVRRRFEERLLGQAALAVVGPPSGVDSNGFGPAISAISEEFGFGRISS